MQTKELLEQANERVKNINKAMQELEEFESVMKVADEPDSKVSISGNYTTYLHTVLDPVTMDSLKTTVLNTLTEEKERRVLELELMINPAPRKAATINPEFEKAVNDMIEHNQAKIVKIVKDEFKEVVKEAPKAELTVELIQELYHEKDMTLDQVANELGVTRTTLYKFITEKGLRKPSKKERETFRDSKVQAKKPR